MKAAADVADGDLKGFFCYYFHRHAPTLEGAQTMFGRKANADQRKESVDSLDVENKGNKGQGSESMIDPAIFIILERLEKVGAQVLVRLAGREMYTTTLVGLGHDGFFIDTLTPPSGDGYMAKGAAVELEAVLGGISYNLSSRVMKKVRFLDELPAFKLSYPATIVEARRRKSPRVLTEGAATISFTKPFKCDVSVHDISIGGLAFEYNAELGRLPVGTLLGGVLLDLIDHAVIEVHPEVVGNVVVELGALSLPNRYRTSVSFTNMGRGKAKIIKSYIETLRNR